MKKNRIDFKEKRRYAIKKVSGKTASVFIGATIFGIILSSNLSIDNTKADTVSNTTATTISNDQTSETSNVVTLGNNQKNENNSNEAAGSVQAGSVQNVTSNAESNVSAENKAPSTENATLKSDIPEASAPAESSANTSAAPAMRMAASTTTGSDRNAATVDGNNVNTQEAEENKKLANETGLTSSDNYSSNIYKGTDGNYYKVITIYGKDYVYRPVKVYANGTATGQWATRERDTRTNIITTKEDLGNGKVKWTVVFFPNKGLQNYNSKLSGLQSAKFGVALTKDYQIIGDVTVNIDSIADANHTYTAMTGHGSGGDHAFTPEAHVVQSFNPNTDVDPSGWINSSTMPGENNDYILGPYYFTTENSVGKQNLGNTFFKEETVNNNVYTQQQFIGGVHDLWTDNYTIRNEDSNALDGGDYYKKHLIYDPLYNGRYDHTDGFFNSDDFGSAMIFKSHGKSGTPQFSSFTISFVAQHTDSYQSDLAKGPNRQQFSGIIANTYSYQDAYYNMYSISLGEQRSLKKVGKSYVETQPGDKISNWQKGEDALARINKEYLNDEQINNLKNKIHKNIENSELIEQIVTTGNDLNDSMKALGNSVGIYDDNNEYTNRIVDNVKNSDKYIYASKEKQKAYDDAVIAAQNVIDKTKGKYADKTTVETLTKNVNDAFDALDGVKTVNIPTEKVPVKDLNNLSEDEKAQVKKNVEDANKTLIDNGVTVTVDNKGNATITYLDKSTYEISSTDLVEKTNTDADKNELKVPSDKVKVDNPNKLTEDEKSEVVKAVEDANKDEEGKSTLPEGSKVTVGDNGDVTVTYPDGSKDTIPGDKVVEGKSDADKNELKVPSDKVKVDNPNKLTEDEKSEVVKAVEDANKDEEGKSTLPEGSKVTVGDNGDVTVTYPDGSKDTIPGDKVVEGKSDADKNELKVPSDKVKVDNPNKLTEDEKSEVVKAVEDANKDENGKSTLPEGSKVTVGDNGDVTVTYPDGSKDTIPGDKVVEGKSDADNTEPKVSGDKVKVDDPNKLTEDEKSEVVKAVEDANKDENGKSTLPEGSKVTVGDNGDVTVTYPDGSKDTIPGDKVVEGKSDADKNELKVPSDKVKVDNPNKLTEDEKSEVVKAVEDANKDEEGKSTLPEGSKVTVGDNGDVTVTYPDGSKDTIPGDKVVEGKSDADKNELKVPSDKVKVDNPNKLTEDEKSEVVKAVEDANKDEEGKSTLPEGSKVTAGDNGDVTVTYPDGSKDTIPGNKVVEGKSDAEKNEPKEPGDKVKVDDPNKLTEDEKSEVVKAVEDANKDENGKSTLPEGSKVTVGDNGDVTVTYPDGSKDTIPGDKVVEGKSDAKSDADKNEPKEPGDKVKVDDPNKLTEDEKSEVVKAVEDANKDENGKSTLPEGSKVTVGDNGDVTVTYPDGSKDTIPGDKVVEGKSDADKNEPKVSGDKVKVDDPNKLTEDEKSEVVKAVEDANKDENGKSTLPEGSKVTVGDNGDVTVTYPDGSKDTIPGDKVVEGKSDAKSDADKNEPKEPGDKVKVDDPNKLTEDEKSEVVKAVEDANKDENGKSTLPEGSKVTVGDNGDVTVTYPDGSKDTIPGDKVVEGKSDADKNEPKVSGDKVKVDDPNKLTEDEKSEVVKAVEDANKDENGKSTLPEGSKVTVGDNGDVTVTYPDGSKDTIPGDKVVEGKSDADKNEPKEPGDKVKVDDPNKLTEDEKSEVVKAVEDANKDENGKSTLPEGSKVTVGDNGDVTVTYPDGSKDTIPGDKVVEGKSDADKNEPKVSGDKVKVDDPNKLTEDEKSEVVKAVEDANKDENGKSTLPEGSKVTVGDNGDVTVTYPDGSKDTIPGDKVVEGKSDAKSDADKNEPKEPGDKVKVDDPNKLTEDEKSEVVKAVEDANKDENGKSTLPEGSKVTVGDNGDVTVTYPDGSKDTIPGDKVVEGKSNADNTEPKVSGDKVKVDDPNKLTEDEKSEVVKAVEDANKDENGKSTLPEGSKVTVGDNGDVTVTYPDGSKDTIPGDKVVEGKSDADNTEPKVSGDKVKVDDPNKLTEDEKSEVVKAVEDANKDENGKSTLPEGSKVTVGDNGDVTVTYPDGSKDTIPGDKVVEGKSDADKNELKVPSDKVKVDNPNKLTEDEKSEVVKAVEDANKDEEGKSTLPEGSKVTVGDNGDVTVTYPDGSKDTIPGDKVVEGKSDADKNELKVPSDKVKVDNPNKLTEDEKSEVVKAVEDANKDEEGKSTLPEGSKVTAGDNGDVTVTYPDGSKDTIPGNKVVEGKSDAEKNEPKEPGDKVKVDDPNKLTEDEKSEVVKAVEDANKDENGKSTLPEGSKVTVGDNGDVTVTYPDGSKDTIPGDKVVEGKSDAKSDADKNEPKEPGDKVKVDDPNKLTEDEKSEVVKAVEDANKDENGKSTLPEGSKVTVGDNGDVTVTYPDGSKDTIPGDKVVEGKSDADKNEPKVSGDKVKVDDPNKLTEDEKSEVVKAVEDANKDENGKSTLPEGSKVTVGDNGDVTVTYPDGSKDTIPGDKVVEGKSDAKSDADKNEPKEPGDKVKVDDPNKLTEDEKSEVVKAVEDANKDENGKSTLPEGSKVTVGDNGDVTVTYPDGSKDTIPGDKVVEGKSDADKNEPKVSGDKVKVDDPNKLTEDEKSEVVKAVEDANKDENGKSTLPEGSKVTVGDNGDVTVTYPDGSKDTIPGDKVVEGKSDADKNEPKEPGDKVKVDDPNKLTEDEKSEVVKAVEDANKDENGKSTLPEGSKVTVGDNGDVTVTYPDGSKDTIPGDKVVEGKSDADKNELKEPSDKVKVDDPNKLTEDEKSEVVKAVEDANKDENGKPTLPEGSKVTVGDNGDVTVTYPDGSKDTIPGDKVVEGKSDADKNELKEPSDKVKVDDPNKLTEDEKSEVVKAVEDANKDENGKSTLPEGSKVTVGDNGDVTVTYPDGSKDTIPGDKVVEGKSDADKNEPKEPGDKVKVDDPNKLTEDEKSEVVKAVEDANKDENGKSTLPEGSKVTVGDNGDVTVTYPDGSKDTIPGDKVVEGKSDADNTEPKVSGDKVKVDDPNKLTEDEKSEVVKAVEDANKDENGKSTLPEGSKVTVGDNGDVTVTYPDGSKDTIPGDKVVEGKSNADNTEPKVSGDKVKVDDPNKLTEDEKSEVVKAVEDANKDENGKSTLPEGSKVTVGDNGDVTVTYPDGSKDTIPGDKVVEGKSDADKNEPKVSGDKVKVDDPNKLTEDEKSEVVKAVEDANKDENGKSTLPEGSKVTVGDNGDVTVTYPDGSKDTIPGDKVVEGKSDADNTEPKVSGDKVKVDDPNKLTEDEKSEVVKAVEDANKDENGKSTLPEGSKVTVGDNGDVTVTYPDGSKDTIPGDKVVEGKSNADNTEPKVSGDKVKVDDPNKLTEDEKSEVVKAVEDANKDENGKSTLPEGSKVTVGDNGDVTVTYPDGSKDTIPGDKVLEGKSDVKSDAKSDADKNEPKEPGDKVKVDDPNKLTDSEKEELSNNLEKLNPGTVVTIADDGTATLTYPDGSTNTIPGSQLVTAKGNGNTTNSNVKVTPTNTNNKINKDNNSLGKNTANAKAGELPQTGETNDSQKLSVIGMALMGILGLFGLGKKRKKD